MITATRKITRFLLLIILLSFISCYHDSMPKNKSGNNNGNPIDTNWYADPEGVVFGEEYWIFPTTSAEYEKQVYLDAFSSKDLVNWEKHERILDTSIIKWARQAMWAPAAIEHHGKYFLFFSANDIQRPNGPMWDPQNDINHYGGIGIAVADHPQGPYQDYLGKPLVSDFYNDAQPIDQFVFRDDDSTLYFFYGGWGHCNIGVLNDSLNGFIRWEDGHLFKEITPDGYVEGPFMFKRNDIYYFMWSEGGWGNSSYHVAYATAEKASGPFQLQGTILKSDTTIATGAGHHSVIHTPETDLYYMVYHRRPIPNLGRDHRVICIDKLEFDDKGKIKPVQMTFEGVEESPINPN